MKAAVYYENGDPGVLKYEDVPDPECHPKGIVIKVEAISIEGGDTLNRWRGALTTRPHIVGYQAAGEIVAVGSEVTTLRLGHVWPQPGRSVRTPSCGRCRHALRGVFPTALIPNLRR